MNRLQQKLYRYHTEEKGSSIVIIALAFTALSLIAALVFDIGIAYYHTGEYENAADAAALAAGQLLPVSTLDTFKIYAMKHNAIEYAAKNGVTGLDADDIELTGVQNGYYTKLAVHISANVETNFARVIGIRSLNVVRSAKVRIAPVYKVYGAVPFAVKENVLDYCIANNMTTHIALKFGGGSGTQGDYGVIDLDCVKSGGANDVELWLKYGYTSMLNTGETLYPVEPGNMVSVIDSAVQNRYDSCTHYPALGGCTAEHFEDNCPRIMTVPVVVNVENKYVKIVGFAAFILEPLQETGFVYGSLVKKTIAGVASDAIDVGGAGDYWLYSLVLTD